MTAYDPTWNDDSAGYNAHTERSFTKIESELAKMWLGGDNGGNRNSTWNERAASRSLFDGTSSTEFSAPTDSHRLVVASVNLEGSGNVSGTSDVEVALELSSDFGSNGVEYTPGSVSQQSGLNGQTRRYILCSLILPGEEYRFNKTGGDSANLNSSEDAQVYEFDFDSFFTTQGWTHGDTLFNDDADGTPNLNTYANGANDVCRMETAPSFTSKSDPSYGSQISVGSVATFTNLHFTMGQSTSGGDTKIEQFDQGGSGDVVAWPSVSNNTSIESTVPLLINPNGSYQATQGGGGDVFENAHEWEFALHSSITFADSDSPSTVGSNLRTLDTNAADGWNQTLDVTRNDAGTGTGSRTPSNNRNSIVMAHANLTPTSTASGEVFLDVDDGSGVDVRAKLRHAGLSATVDNNRTIMALLAPGDSWSLTTNNASIQQRTEWIL